MSKVSKLNKNHLLIENQDKNNMGYEQIIINKNKNKVIITTTYDGTYGSNSFELNQEQVTQLLEFFKQ